MSVVGIWNVRDDPGLARRRRRAHLIKALIGVAASAILLPVVLAIGGPTPAPQYATADAMHDAVRAVPWDTRYLAVWTDHPVVPLPAGRHFPPGDTFDVPRDVQLLPPVSDPALQQAQAAYIERYNGTMLSIAHASLKPGEPLRRPTPLSAAALCLGLAAVVVPLMLILVYLRWRLDPYVPAGRAWSDMAWWDWDPFFWIRLVPRRYPDEAKGLVYGMWITLWMMLPAAVLFAWWVGYRPII